MTETATQTSPGLFARAIGIIVSPGSTFRAIVTAPRPFGILFVVCVALAIATAIPFLTEAGQQAMLDVQVRSIEQFTGQPVSNEQYVQMQQGIRMGAIFGTVGIFIMVPVITLLTTALYWALFNLAFGGTATFMQVLGVTAHASVISALGALLGAAVQVATGTYSQSGPFNLGPLAVGLAPTHPLALLLGGLTVFSVWQAVVNGIGLAVLYRRPATGIVIVTLVVLIAITAVFTVGPALIFGR